MVFARLPPAGTVSVELGDPFATYFGWTLPWDAPVTLVDDSADQVEAARRQRALIGVVDDEWPQAAELGLPIEASR